MKTTDKTIIFGVAGLLLLAAFWFMLLSPKRKDAAKLGTEVSSLETKVSEQEQLADFAEQAKQDFPSNYQRLVTLGKAVPAGDDSASLLVELSRIASTSGVEFRGIALGEEASSGAAPAPATGAAPPVTSQPTTTAPPPAEGEQASTEAAAPAPATEVVASTLPIGATVGPAGLNVLPYKLHFRGDFFKVADFIQGLDSLVATDDGRVAVDGRLTTIDGFALSGDSADGFPMLNADFLVTTYLAPPAQGLLGGATPSGPATPGAAPQQTVASTATPGGTP